jgi:hypothetical protein
MPGNSFGGDDLRPFAGPRLTVDRVTLHPPVKRRVRRRVGAGSNQTSLKRVERLAQSRQCGLGQGR